MTARSALCRCESNFTCGHCFANAKPYHFTPSTVQEQMARQIAAKPCKGCGGYHFGACT